MFAKFLRPDNLSQKVMRVTFSIYLIVTFFVTSVQFTTEYIKTQDSILSELEQLEQTFLQPIATSMWQYNQKQMEALVTGLLEMPIIVGVDIFDKHAEKIISKRSYRQGAPPLSIFDKKSDLRWMLNGEEITLGTLTLYSSSEVVLNRVLFGFALIAVTAIIKLSILFGLFVWAFDRFLARPLKELMSQVDEVQQSRNFSKRINLSVSENNEINKLQDHMNNMLSAMEQGQRKLLEDEQAKRNWLEEAVAKRTEELQILNGKLKDLAANDSLTGALNRGSFFETARHLFMLSKRQKSQASFVLMDLDHFKKVNDTYGHFIGDKVLAHFADTIQNFLRKSDLFGRLGGEEFAIFLPDTGIENASHLADKLRRAIGSTTLELDGKTVTYTVSFGVTSSEEQDSSVDELFKRADLKLYGAKEKGRNRVER